MPVYLENAPWQVASAGGVRDVVTPHLLKVASMLVVSASALYMVNEAKSPVHEAKAVAISCIFASVMLAAYDVHAVCLEAQLSAL